MCNTPSPWRGKKVAENLELSASNQLLEEPRGRNSGFNNRQRYPCEITDSGATVSEHFLVTVGLLTLHQLLLSRAL